MTASPTASTHAAGALMAGSPFEIPAFQREYSWEEDQVADFWRDLSSNVTADDYFLGLLILTKRDGVNEVIDGQQRLVTLTLLAKALSNKAKDLGRDATATHIDSVFIKSLDPITQSESPRVEFRHSGDNDTFASIIDDDFDSVDSIAGDVTSRRMVESFKYLTRKLDEFLLDDSAERLGELTNFIKDKLYFAVFSHPDDTVAFRIFEAINTRGRKLTTADLLKNHILSEADNDNIKEKYYEDWQRISKEFSSMSSSGNLVQYIRHVVISKYGHVPGTELYNRLSGKRSYKEPLMPVSNLLDLLNEKLDLYRQIEDPKSSQPGPLKGEALKIFSAFDDLDVLSVRPILLALGEIDNGVDGMKYLLRQIVRLMVVSNIGVGKSESVFGQAARNISNSGTWANLSEDLSEFDKSRNDFIEQLPKRKLSKRTLAFIRQSALQNTIVPKMTGHLHYIWPKKYVWGDLASNNSKLESTIGNTIIVDAPRRPPKASESWKSFKETLLESAVDYEITETLRCCRSWDTKSVDAMGKKLTKMAADVWYKST